MPEITNIENLESLEKIEDAYNETSNCNIPKINKSMLWHARLEHASLTYLKKLQKLEKKLEKVKFDDTILDCEICISTKMDKLQFK